MYCVPYNYNITVQEGGTYDKDFAWTVSSLLTPVPIADCTALFQFRKKATDVDPLLEMTDVLVPWEADGASGIYILDDGATPDLIGKWKIYIRDEDSLGLCEAHKDIGGVYNMFLYTPDDEAILKQYGTFTVVAAIARRVIP